MFHLNPADLRDLHTQDPSLVGTLFCSLFAGTHVVPAGITDEVYPACAGGSNVSPNPVEGQYVSFIACALKTPTGWVVGSRIARHWLQDNRTGLLSLLQGVTKVLVQPGQDHAMFFWAETATFGANRLRATETGLVRCTTVMIESVEALQTRDGLTLNRIMFGGAEKFCWSTGYGSGKTEYETPDGTKLTAGPLFNANQLSLSCVDHRTYYFHPTKRRVFKLAKTANAFTTCGSAVVQLGAAWYARYDSVLCEVCPSTKGALVAFVGDEVRRFSSVNRLASMPDAVCRYGNYLFHWDGTTLWAKDLNPGRYNEWPVPGGQPLLHNNQPYRTAVFEVRDVPTLASGDFWYRQNGKIVTVSLDAGAVPFTFSGLVSGWTMSDGRRLLPNGQVVGSGEYEILDMIFNSKGWYDPKSMDTGIRLRKAPRDKPASAYTEEVLRAGGFSHRTGVYWLHPDDHATWPHRGEADVTLGVSSLLPNGDRETTTCNHCGRTVANISYTEVTWHHGTTQSHGAMCGHCAGSLGLHECNDCHQLFDTLLNDHEVCPSCAERNWGTCTCCNMVVRRHRLTSSGRCPECAQGVRVRSYCHKPTPKFHGSGPIYFGAEIELEFPDMDNEEAIGNAIEPLMAHPKITQFLYAKHDGSLSRGAEFVTHPFSLPWYKDNLAVFDKLFTDTVDMGAEAKATCGLHIHVSRGPFDPAAEFRLMQLIYTQKSFWLKASRRHASRLSYCKYELGIRDRIRVSREKDPSPDRYVALNATRFDTLEFRLFAGVQTHEDFASALHLTAAACDFAINRKGVAPTADKFVGFIKDTPTYAAALARCA
jgi:hypothetical protein